MNEFDDEVGRINIVKNDHIYVLNTLFIPTTRVSTTTKPRKIKKRNDELTKFTSKIIKIIKYLNKNLLNQALIYVNVSVDDIFEIDRSNANTYTNEIIDIYKNGKMVQVTSGTELENAEDALDKSIKLLSRNIIKSYRKSKNEQYFCKATFDRINPKLLNMYKKSLQKV